MEKLKAIIAALEDGREVYFSTYTHAIRITPRNYKKWKRDGIDMFKVDAKDSLYIRSGKRWDCVDYCKVSVVPSF